MLNKNDWDIDEDYSLPVLPQDDDLISSKIKDVFGDRPLIPSNIREFLEKYIWDVDNFDEKIVPINSFDFGIFNDAVMSYDGVGMVPISQILGYDEFHMTNGDTLLSNLKTFFDLGSKGISYETRSNSIFEIPLENIMEQLSVSFKKEPIQTTNINDSHFISSNGLHRFTALKLAYLIEMQYGKTKEELDSKYIVPVESEKIDEVKTFCKVMLKYIVPDLDISSEFTYEPTFRRTGNVKMDYQDKRIIMSDDELLSFTLNKMNELKSVNEYDEFLNNLSYRYGLSNTENENTTLYKLVSKYAPGLLIDIEANYSKGDGLIW